MYVNVDIQYHSTHTLSTAQHMMVDGSLSAGLA